MLSQKHYIINSLHVVTGGLVLVTSLVLTLRAHRGRFPVAESLGSTPRGARPPWHRRTTAGQPRGHGHEGLGLGRRQSGGRAPSAPATSHYLADLVTLTKPRLNLLVLLTTLAGLYLAAPDGVPAGACWCTRWSGRRWWRAAPPR